MPIENPQDACQGPPANGPRDQARRVCRLNAHRHVLTGQIAVKTLTSSRPMTITAASSSNPSTRPPISSVSSRNRSPTTTEANRARAIEDSTFAMGMHGYASDSTGSPQVDDAFSQARTWAEQARNLALLTVYAQRIQRAVDKNTAQLKALQTERKELAAKAMKQAKMLYELAEIPATLPAGGIFRPCPADPGVCFFSHGNRPRTEPRKTARRASRYHYLGKSP